MNTRDLARKLNAIEVINVDGVLSNQNRPKQIFDYLFVLDFEATCWDKVHKSYPSEIIEFPVVLYEIRTKRCLEEFQQYIKPTEHPELSEFCTKLTGITQKKIDSEGIDLRKCMELFKGWMEIQLTKYNIQFPYLDVTSMLQKCAFVTWSDWDIRTCLRNECLRKHLELPNMFQKWIDLRKIYKVWYKRPLDGLEGALSEVGLRFEGTPHCGLHDARNTARLAGRMIDDNVVLIITNK